MRGALPRLILVAASIAVGPPARAAGQPVVITAAAGSDAGLVRKVREIVASRRPVRDDLALPPPASISPEKAAMAERAASVRHALDRARRAESDAAWDTCVREATAAMSDALEVLARVDDLALLRELDLQIGACLTLAGSAASARSYFVSAALLEEARPPVGLHREEAERAAAEALAEVSARARGKVRIESTPPGAEIWIDGRRAAGTTPIEVEVRLGEHFLTLRRFRFEAHTALTRLSPNATVRVALDPAQRGALRDQLGAVAAGAITPSEEELALARAVWSRAEQLVAVAPEGVDRARVRVLDAVTGQPLRSAQIAARDADDAIRRAICDALGETCEPRARGVPWYVWPIAGAALVGGAVSTAFLVNANRDYKFVACPAIGCK